jgi:site-specific DNA recombinase
LVRVTTPAEHKRLQDRINAMYIDKLDGLVDTAFYDRMSNQWREEQNRRQRDRTPPERGQTLQGRRRCASRPRPQRSRLFAEQEPRENGAGDKAKSAKTEIWLGDLDSNQD